jgi:hypothetical protein
VQRARGRRRPSAAKRLPHPSARRQQQRQPNTSSRPQAAKRPHKKELEKAKQDTLLSMKEAELEAVVDVAEEEDKEDEDSAEEEEAEEQAMHVAWPPAPIASVVKT